MFEIINKEVKNLDYLKNLLIVLNNCSTIEEVNQIVGERIKELLPDSYIIISISDEFREYSRVNKMFGFEKTLDKIKKYLKYDPREYKYPIRESKLKELEDYTSGKLVEFPDGLYEITNGKIPKFVCRTLEKLHKVKKIYGMGYSQNCIIYGTVAILSQNEIDSSVKTVCESIINQASLIIQKKFTEKYLKQTEDKYKHIIENVKLAILLINRDGVVEYVNNYGEILLRKSKLEILSHNIKDLLPAVIAVKLFPDIVRVIDTNKEYIGEREYCLNGNHKWYSTTIQPLYKPENESTVAMVMSAEITEKKLLENELRNATKSIEESEKMKTDYLANFSHEIRSLMNGIIGFAQLIKDTDSRDVQNEYADIINTNGLNLLKIFNKVIDIAKIEAGVLNAEYNEFAVNRELEDIYNIFKSNPKIYNKQIDFILTKNPKDIVIISDEIKFRQIFINLIDNAIKFCDKGLIEYGYCINENNKLVYFVKDTGIGIAKQNQDKVFRRFYQGEDINTRRYDGAGIGLSLVKGYIDVMKGKIWLESEKGKGTTFFFTLP